MNIVAESTIDTLKSLGYEVAEEDWSVDQSAELMVASSFLTEEQFKSAGFNSNMKPEIIRKVSMDIYMDSLDKELSLMFGRA